MKNSLSECRMGFTSILPRILNRLSALSFCSYASRNCNFAGQGLYVAYNWSLVHPECISIGNNFLAGTKLGLQCFPEYRGKTTYDCRSNGERPKLVIGDNVCMSCNCQISCVNMITIGDNCLFGDSVFITDNFHGASSSFEELNIPPILRKLSCKGSVIIGKNCWFGRNVCVMSGVTVGDGCVIGANAVVTHDIPAYSVAAGIPAKVIRRVG